MPRVGTPRLDLYRVRQVTARELIKRFTYHPPQGNQTARYEEIRDRAKEFALFLSAAAPVSRELSLALTSLENCVMHANSAIARNETWIDGELVRPDEA